MDSDLKTKNVSHLITCDPRLFFWQISSSLSEDGRTMVMGDPGRRGEAGLGGNRGHAHVYFFDEDSWEQIGPNIEGDAPGM